MKGTARSFADTTKSTTPEDATKDIQSAEQGKKEDSKNSAKLYRGSYVADILVSAKLSESHSLAATTVETALESGAVVSDHVIIKPESVTVTFNVANTGQGQGGKSGLARTVFEAFEKLRQERTLLELTTDHKIYDNMVLVEFSPVETAPYKGSLTCTAVFKKIYFVELQSIGRNPGNLGGAAKKTASAPKDAGQQDGPPMEESRAYQLGKSAGSVT